MDVYHEILVTRVWAVPEGAGPNARYTVRLNLENRGNGVCEACGAIGELDRKTIINIGLKALELGYHTLTSKAAKEDKVTDLLTLTHSDDTFNYYKANIMDIAIRLGIEVR